MTRTKRNSRLLGHSWQKKRAYRANVKQGVDISDLIYSNNKIEMIFFSRSVMDQNFFLMKILSEVVSSVDSLVNHVGSISLLIVTIQSLKMKGSYFIGFIAEFTFFFYLHKKIYRFHNAHLCIKFIHNIKRIITVYILRSFIGSTTF
jgi:hypothetical protein